MQDALAYLGIDPGKQGAAAIILHKDRTSAPIIGPVFKFADKTDGDICEHFQSLIIDFDIKSARIERVSSSPQMGVVSAFTFGRGYGFLHGLLLGLGIPYEEVAPLTWQNALKCVSGGDKKITRAKAQQLFSNQIKIIHGNADAILIALFCSRKDRGLL